MKKDYYGDEEWFSGKSKIYNILPIMVIVFLVPLAVRLVIIDLNEEVYKYWTGEAIYGDIFSYVKMTLTLIITMFIFISIMFKYSEDKFSLKGDKRYTKYIVIYCICAILSFLFSKYKLIGFNGFIAKNESVWILVSYMIILFASIKLVETEKHAKLILWSISIGALILGVIGITQVIKNDIWTTRFGQSLIIPSKYKEIINNGIEITMAQGTAYGTLNNTNYMGSYSLLVIPITIALFFMSKNLIGKVFAVLTTVIMVINLFGSNSRAGIVGAGIAILAAVIILSRRVFRKYKGLCIGLIMIVTIIFIGSYFVMPNNINPIKRLVSDFTNNDNGQFAREWLKDIVVDNNNVKIITVDNELFIEKSELGLVFKDGNGSELETYKDDEFTMKFKDSRYKDYIASITYNAKEELILSIEIKNLDFAADKKLNFYFNINGEKIFLCDNKGYKLSAIEADSIGFKGNEKLGSTRGYIWSRTLPLLRGSILLGYGPDSFPTVFPQYDLKGKIVAYGNTNMVVDKPHNYYLEVATNTGVISLIALLCIFITYLISCIRIFRNINYKNVYHIISFSIFISIIGYLGAAFFNDSIIGVAVVFWVMLGIGIATNWNINKECEKNVC